MLAVNDPSNSSADLNKPTFISPADLKESTFVALADLKESAFVTPEDSLLVGCIMSQQYAIVSQGRICSVLHAAKLR